MLEKTLQKKITTVSLNMGIVCVKVDSTSSRGWPDLTAILPNGVVLLLEIKTETGRLSPLQKAAHEKIKRNNGNVYTIRSVEQFTEVVKKHSDT